MLRLIRRLTLLYGAGVLALVGAMPTARISSVADELYSGGVGGLALGAMLLALAGLLGVWPMVQARLDWARQQLAQSDVARATSVREVWAQADGSRPDLLGPDSLGPDSLGPDLLGDALARQMPGRRGGFGRWRWMQWRRARSSATIVDAGRRLSRLARRPQGIIVPLLCAAAAAAAWGLRPGVGTPGSEALLVGASAIVLSFPLLVAERVAAGGALSTLPEAAALRALLLLPVIVIPVAGLLAIAAGLSFGWAHPAMRGVAVLLMVVAAELSVRALANWFLPPPAPDAARAAIASAAVMLLQPGRVAPGGLATPLRTHLGLDFSRSWALRYLRAAALPTALLMGLIGWALTGVTLVDLDRRGIVERFGSPYAVWQPGAHVGLPWPLGRVRLVELGVVHTMGLGGDGPGEPMAGAPVGAEAVAPASADRLWEVAHPSELSTIVASTDTAGAQSFQSVSVDLKVLYRTGLDDVQALQAAYAVVSPEALVRAEMGRLLARMFAGQTLPAVIGENREALSEGLRTNLQAELDRAGGGLEVLGVVIEAIHPPPGAAEAYHNVQAAEIVANTAIATERGRAQASAAMARQQAAELTAVARGAAADTVGQADVLLRTFAADHAAAAVGGQAFLLERYYANLAAALARSPLVIVDHRLHGAEAPVIDLRSFGAPGAARGGDED